MENNWLNIPMTGATTAQRRFLHRLGVDDRIVASISFDEAQTVLDLFTTILERIKNDTGNNRTNSPTLPPNIHSGD
jgi:hypothetical protein